MRFLKRQIPFVAAIRKKLLVATILGAFLAVLIIFLEPFDTNQYQSRYKLLLLSGFGVVFAASYFMYSLLEDFAYKRVGAEWRVIYEGVSIVVFFAVAGTLVYLYNYYVINETTYAFSRHVWYLTHIVAPMMPVVAPLLIFLRNRMGEKKVPAKPDECTITGLNNNEEMRLRRSDVLYVKSVENYVEIVFMDANGERCSETFRQTLAAIQTQLSFLEKSHRSYLVNLENVSKVEGNSQKSQLCFSGVEDKIPIAKANYKSLKSKLT